MRRTVERQSIFIGDGGAREAGNLLFSNVIRCDIRIQKTSCVIMYRVVDDE